MGAIPVGHGDGSSCRTQGGGEDHAAGFATAEALPLFDFARLAAPTDEPVDTVTRQLVAYARCLAASRGGPAIVYRPGKPPGTLPTQRQLKLPFRENVVDFIPVRRRGYLNLKLIDLFAADTALCRAAVRMTRDGIEDLGQLVQMDRSDVLPYLRNQPDYLERLEYCLGALNFRLNSPMPWWAPVTARLIER